MQSLRAHRHPFLSLHPSPSLPLLLLCTSLPSHLSSHPCSLRHPTFFLLPRCGFHHHQLFPGLSPVSASSALTRQGGVGVGGGALLLDELSPSAVYSSEALFHQTMHDTTLSHCLRVVCREAAGVALEMPGWRPAALTVSSYCSYCCTQPQLLTVLPQGDCQLLARLSVERGGGQAARGVGEEALSSLAK